MADPSASYLRYSPAVETIADDEAETAQSLMETMRSVSEKTLADGGHAIRSVHAKSHGFLEGELEVASGLPPILAQGLFSKPATYPVILRLSTLPGDILDDSVSTPRGLAVKIIGVEGERLEGSEGDVTQDLVLVNGPAFGAPTPKAFLATLKLLAATTNKAQGFKKVVSGAMRGVQEIIVSTTGKPNAAVATMGGQPETHILGETFYSQVPMRFGDYVAKLCVVPVAPELTALTDKPLAENGGPNALREAVVEFFRVNGGLWEVRAQLCTGLGNMPVENAATVWPESESMYQTVARIRVKPQTAWSEARSSAVDDGLSFSPWHGLAAHQPLGGIMRSRKQAYEMSKRFRAERNGCTITEPCEAINLP